MNLRDLEYVVAVAKYNNFSKAAIACNVSQPALSNQIKKLEQELGSDLFHRLSQDITPTELGQRVVESAVQVLSETLKIKDMATEYRDPTALPIRIGLIPTLAPYIMHYLIERIRSVLPNIEIKIYEEKNKRLANMIINRELDIALSAERFDNNQLDFTPLFYEPIYLAVNTDQQLPEKIEINLEGKISSDFHNILYLRDLEQDNKTKNRALIESDRVEEKNLELMSASIETACRHVEMNGGYAIIPALAARQIRETSPKLKFINIRNENSTRLIGILSRVGCPRKPLLETLCKQVNDLPPNGVQIVETNLNDNVTPLKQTISA